MVPVLAASAGVVVAHAVDYAIVYPSASERAAHLRVTGHGYWPLAVAVALGAAGLALLLAAGRGASRRRPATPPSGRWVNAGTLLAVQAVAFAILEMGERALAGLPPSVLLHSPDIWLGMLLQVPVAVLAARLLGAVEHAACRVAEALRRPTPRRDARPVWRPAATAAPGALLLVAATRPRGPPLPTRA